MGQTQWKQLGRLEVSQERLGAPTPNAGVLRKELAVLLSIAKFKLKMENISTDYGYNESW